MKKIGVIGAMAVEVEGLKRAAQDIRQTQIAGMCFCVYKIKDKKLTIPFFIKFKIH